MAKRSGATIELLRLRRFVDDVSTKYFVPHFTAVSLGSPPKDEILDVAAFVVLIHGALENFVEGLTVWMAGRVESAWIKSRRISRSTASLLLRAKCNIDDETNQNTTFDIIRVALDEAKWERSAAAKANNGVALKHVRQLLGPLGVDVPTDPLLVASLETLVAMRHEWAHQSRFGSKNPKGARDVKNISDDCLLLAEQLSSKVAKMRL